MLGPGQPEFDQPTIGWNTTAQKLIPVGAHRHATGHLKTVEAMKWMKEFHEHASYYVPAHLERAGQFNPNGNNGYNIEHLRNFNNAAPKSAFGFESQPGHGASGQRGEYQIRRNGPFTTGGPRVDSVGGTTYGGTGVYAAQIGGVWDALLGEGRNWWFFGSSDWHSRRCSAPTTGARPATSCRASTSATTRWCARAGEHWHHDRDDDDRDDAGAGAAARAS